MKSATEALERGERAAAREAGAEARSRLEEALGALERGEKGLDSRSAEEKASDLQRKLEREAEKARDEVAELEKKLREKGKPETLGAAEESLAGASESMREAREAAEGENAAVQKEKQTEALERLRRAEEALRAKAEEELARLERKKLKENAPPQEELARAARQLAGESGQQAEGMESAAESMEQAAQNLDQENASAAEENQEAALEKLEKARRGLEEEEARLEELKREEEVLSMLNALGEVKAGQEVINKGTQESEVKKAAAQDEGGRLSRRQEARLERDVRKLAGDQGDLATRVDELTGKLESEFSRVFSFVLKNVSADMRQVRDALEDLDTGSYTQFVENEIVADLEKLIAALKEELEPPPPPQEGQGRPPGGPPPLVPTVRELIMLKEMQLKAGRSTRDLEDLRVASDGKVTESWERALNRLYQKQGSISLMTEKLIEDFRKAQGEGGAGPGDGSAPPEDGGATEDAERRGEE
jgi:chromosome segregation ATPase